MLSRPLVLLSLLAGALVGFVCTPWPYLPSLVASSVTQGETISRSDWFVLDFATAVDPASLGRASIWCGGFAEGSTPVLLDSDTLVLQPFALLPAAASCFLRVATIDGPAQIIDFQTAPAGVAFVPVHDRTDPDQPLPFPDDAFLVSDPGTVTGWRPAVSGRIPNPPGNAVFLLQSLAGVADSDSDGWSPIGPISVQLSGAVDPGTLPLDRDSSRDPLGSVALLDLTPGSTSFGERIPFSLIPRIDTLSTEPTVHALVILPGIPLEPEGTYGLVVTDRVLDLSGEPLVRSPFFDLVVAPFQPGEAPEVTASRPLVEEVLGVAETLSPLPIPRDDVALAVRITIRSTDHFPDDVLAMRQHVLATPPNVVVNTVTPDANIDVAAILEGSFDVPIWLDGPYVSRDAQGLPQAIGTQSIPFILALPTVAETNGLAPIVMYQHGNPGSAEGEVPNAARSFIGSAGFAIGGFTDPLNRLFATIEQQQQWIFSGVFFGGQPQDYYIQTYGEQLAFLRALQSLGGLDVLPVGAPDGIPDLDPTAIVYEGISNGSVHAQAFLAYAPDIRAAAMVAGASRLAELLEYQDRTTPLGGPPFLTVMLPSYLTGVRMPDLWMALALLANTYDRQDPHNHARFLFREPVSIDGSTQKASLLVVEGLDDSFTSNNSTRSLARQLGGIPQLSTPLVKVNDLPEQAAPIQANIDPQTTAAMVQFAPAGGSVPPSPGCTSQTEGHYCAQVAPEARAQRVRFYQSALVGVPVID